MKKTEMRNPVGLRWRLKKGLFPVALLACALLTGGVTAGASALPNEDSVTFPSRQVTVDEVFDAITGQLKLEVFYSENRVDVRRVVQLPALTMRLENLLDEVLGGAFSYALNGNTIVISPVAQQREAGRRVTGVVRDNENQPLPGVSVLLKGTTVGMSTDKNGRYSLVIPDVENIVLVFSFVGMKRQEISCPPGRDTLDVRMVVGEESIEEVVVTGYQRIRRSEMVGSAQTVKREDLFYDGTNTIEQMLQGKLPGTVVMNTDGLVGARQRVRVRGTSTLLSNPEPVWVVDGIIQDDPLPFNVQELGNMSDNFDMIRNFVGNGIAWLNPNDIEDITVLKDASATVLYGVKAANGVIVITTRRGKDEGGGLFVNYSGNFSVTGKLNYRKMNLMNSKERIDVSREIYERRVFGTKVSDLVGYENALSRYLNKEISYTEFDAEVKYLETMNTDWMDILYRAPFSHGHSVSLSGGNERVRYYSSFHFNRTYGIARGNESESYGASFNIDARLTNKLNASARLSGNSSSTSAFYRVDPYTYAAQTSRAIPAWDKMGELFYYPISAGNMFNVLNELAETGNKNNQRSLNASLNVNYTPVEGIRLESMLGLNTSNSVGESYASENTSYITSIRRYNFGEHPFGSDAYRQSPLPHGGELNNTEAHGTSFTWRNGVSYNQVFGRHRLGVLLGHEARGNTTKDLSATVYGYFPDRGKGISLPKRIILDQSGNEIENPLYANMNPRITDKESNYLSFYGSTTYSFDERYVVTGSIRSDASNRFGQDRRNRFLPVWSAGVRWNAHNEPWLKGQDILSELNIRATYGWQGNVAENFSPELIAYIPSNVINGITGEYELKIQSLPYADLRWEKTKTVNLGIDLGFLKNRFTATFEYYMKRTEDMIIYRELPISYGIPSMPMNGGEMTNQGIELSVNGTIIRSGNITWSLSMNTARNINRIASSLVPYNNWQTAVSGQYYKEGYAVSSFWVFKFEGLDQTNGYPLFTIPTKEENPNIVNDATEYMTYAGTLDPDFTGGLSTVFRYKTLSLSGSFSLGIGGKRFLNKLFGGTNTTMGIFHLPSPYYNLSKEYVNRWRQPGDVTEIPSIPSLDAPRVIDPATIDGPYTEMREFYPYQMYDNSDARVVSASYLRCNNLALSYSFTGEWLRRLELKSLSMSASVSNPFMIVSKEYKGIDPEVAAGNQPITRTFSLGLNVSF
ncbi:MAG: SusC/RagA family TonB-linked outer membrane protein [Odoribacteraceae bacterium]|jgi:TonB-linked SusC/RagA family outer membrane protein|nr:SusC/RagA family TonB-linked outer membrane protein [Odoribacteraceae bacterium]